MSKLSMIILLHIAYPAFGKIGVPYVNTTDYVFSKILFQYPEHGVIIHFDNSSLSLADLISNELTQSFKLLINYSQMGTSDRPKGYKFLNIVLLENPFQFEEYCKEIYNLEFNDIVLFTNGFFHNELNGTKNETVSYPWEQTGLERAGNVFLYNITTQELYFVCYFCGKLARTPLKISSGADVPSISDYLNIFRNFQGHHFNIGFIPFPPYVWCSTAQMQERNCDLAGPEGDLLKTMSRRLNFSYTNINLANQTDSDWTAMLDAIFLGAIDWAIGGITITMDRMRIVDYTNYINNEAYTTIYASFTSDSLNYLGAFFMPFHPSVWLSIFGVQIFVIIVMKIASHYLKNDKHLNTFDYFELTYASAIDQPKSQKVGKTATRRMLLIFWWLMAIILTTAYRSKLASIFIKSKNVEPDSLLNLKETNFDFQVSNIDWSALRDHLNQSRDPGYQQVLKLAKNDLDFCMAIAKAIKHKVAVIEEETYMQHEVSKRCSKILTKLELSRLRLTRQEILSSFHAWPLQLAAPYRTQFSRVIGILQASGLLARWYRRATPHTIDKSNQHLGSRSVQALTLETEISILFLLFIGLSLATIIFICEIGFSMYRKLCTKKVNKMHVS